MDGYPAELKRDRDGRVLVDFPDFPEAHTYGDDADEVLTRARDALATIIDAYIDDRQQLPDPSPIAAGLRLVRLPALMKAKVELYDVMRAERVPKTELARRLGWHMPQVDRLLDVHHASRLDQLESAFAALGRDLVVAAPLVRPPVSYSRSGGGGRGRAATSSPRKSSPT